MTFEDWRDADAADVQPLYDAECARYRTRLAWDLAPSCRIVEDARRAGRLPGLLIRGPHGAVRGWTYFVLHDGMLQFGALVADTAAHLRRLLDRVLQSPEAGLARGLSGFLFPENSSVQSAFERQRFSVERHPYLLRRLDPAQEHPEPGPLAAEFRRQPLMAVDPADVVRLTARCYAGQAESRCFAPDGRLDQWAHYLGQLLATPACGTYLPGASFAVERRESRQVLGAVITTAVSPETAHIAQVVVDPTVRRSGIARDLIDAAAAASAAAGCTGLTLIVAEGNAPAMRLYAGLGFTEASSFIFATRAALTRRSSVTPPVRDLVDTASRAWR